MNEERGPLILVPTEGELKLLKSFATFDCAQAELCGFGMVVSAARTAQLIAKHRPSSIVLVGIAGSYSADVPVGSAVQFSEVGCYGVGMGSGADFETAGSMGWLHWRSTETSIKDSIQLAPSDSSAALLTVGAASISASEVADKLKHFPNAVAEDMEGFSVAAACRLAYVPLTIVRGISNMSGDRNKDNWQIADAMQAAAKLAAHLMDGK